MELQSRLDEISEAIHCQTIDIEVADGVEVQEGEGYPEESGVEETAAHFGLSNTIHKSRQEGDAVDDSSEECRHDSLPFQMLSTPASDPFSDHQQPDSRRYHQTVRNEDQQQC